MRQAELIPEDWSDSNNKTSDEQWTFATLEVLAETKSEWGELLEEKM